MSAAAIPARLPGIRTPADLRKRCRVQTNGCWEWLRSSTGSGAPSMWLPALGDRVSIGVVVCWFRTGARPAPGRVWFAHCGNTLCANPAHRTEGSRAEHAAHRVESGRTSVGPIRRARIAAALRRSRRSVLTSGDVDTIRASSDSPAVIAARHGISSRHAAALLRGGGRITHAQGSTVFDASGVLAVLARGLDQR